MSNYLAIRDYAMSPEIKERFTEIVGGSAGAYISSVLIAVSSNEQLQKCEPTSIMRAAARAATLYLTCDPGIGQAYLVPYKDQATLVVGWRGLRDLAYRTGKVRVINVGAIYEGQEWVEDQMTGMAEIKGQKTSNKPIGYFAYVETKDNRKHTEYMTIAEINKHKEKYAKGYQRQQSAWNTDFEKMAKKTVLRQLITNWVELDFVGQVAEIEDVNMIEDMPDPGSVTIVNPLEGKTNSEILSELGFEDAEVTKLGPDEDVIDGEYEDAETETEQEEDTPGATEPPKNLGELYGWCTRGDIPYVGVKDARDAVKQANGEIDIAWEVIVALSRQRTKENEGKSKGNQKGLF